MHRCSGVIVCFSIFFYLEHLIKKELSNNLKPEKSVNLIDTAILIGMTLLAAICTLLNSIQLINNFLSFDQEEANEIAMSVSATFISMLYLLYPFINMKAKKRNIETISTNSTASISLGIGGYVLAVISAILIFTCPFLEQRMTRDINLKKAIENVTLNLINKNIVCIDKQQIIEECSPSQYDIKIIKSEKVKYTKKSASEFELSWVFETNPSDVQKHRTLKNIANKSDMFLNESYIQGQNTKLFKIAEKPKSTTPIDKK
jgi:hypothetical protein